MRYGGILYTHGDLLRFFVMIELEVWRYVEGHLA